MKYIEIIYFIFIVSLIIVAVGLVNKYVNNNLIKVLITGFISGIIISISTWAYPYYFQEEAKYIYILFHIMVTIDSIILTYLFNIDLIIGDSILLLFIAFLFINILIATIICMIVYIIHNIIHNKRGNQVALSH